MGNTKKIPLLNPNTQAAFNRQIQKTKTQKFEDKRPENKKLPLLDPGVHKSIERQLEK